MRLTRTYRAALVFLFVGFLGATGPALDGSSPLLDPTGEPTPSFSVWLDYDTATFSVDSSDGMPGGAGVFNFLVLNGPNPGAFQATFTYDASGHRRFTFPISLLNNGYDMLVGVQCISTALDGTVSESPVFALQTRNYVVTDPEIEPCPGCWTTPGGGIEWIYWPGTEEGPQYPLSRVAIHSGENRSTGQPMLALESGPAGSFPIN